MTLPSRFRNQPPRCEAASLVFERYIANGRAKGDTFGGGGRAV
jgi:hypothetical protein